MAGLTWIAKEAVSTYARYDNHKRLYFLHQETEYFQLFIGYLAFVTFTFSRKFLHFLDTHFIYLNIWKVRKGSPLSKMVQIFQDDIKTVQNISNFLGCLKTIRILQMSSNFPHDVIAVHKILENFQFSGQIVTDDLQFSVRDLEVSGEFHMILKLSRKYQAVWTI